jgi:hypothetical protein
VETKISKRGLPHAHILFWSDFDKRNIAAAESLINTRYPKESPFLDQQEMIVDFGKLIDSYEVHHYSKRYRSPSGNCRFGHPQPIAPQTTIHRHHSHFAHDSREIEIVPPNPLILAYFRCHPCLEVIHSDQCIGYVPTNCSRNSDSGRVSLQNVPYEGCSVDRSAKLQYYAATRISSASECVAGIDGFWRQHLKPTVRMPSIRLPGKKIILISGGPSDFEKVEIPSPLERYLGRLTDSLYDQLTYLEYHSRYSVDPHPSSSDAHPDICEPVRFANQKKKRFSASSIRCIPETRNYLPCDSFFAVIQHETGKICSLSTEKDVKPLTRPLADSV